LIRAHSLTPHTTVAVEESSSVFDRERSNSSSCTSSVMGNAPTHSSSHVGNGPLSDARAEFPVDTPHVMQRRFVRLVNGYLSSVPLTTFSCAIHPLSSPTLLVRASHPSSLQELESADRHADQLSSGDAHRWRARGRQSRRRANHPSTRAKANQSTRKKRRRRRKRERCWELFGPDSGGEYRRCRSCIRKAES
jgi:hypothetical protein